MSSCFAKVFRDGIISTLEIQTFRAFILYEGDAPWLI